MSEILTQRELDDMEITAALDRHRRGLPVNWTYAEAALRRRNELLSNRADRVGSGASK